MPSKKSTQSSASSSQGTQQGGGGVRPPSPVAALAEGMDPVLFLLGIIDKKTRNLEKRKQRLAALEESLINGKTLDKDQKEAVTKLPDVTVQLDLARDFQRQFQNVQAEHLKLQKKKQKQEKMQQKESEQEVVKSTISYALRIQYILTSLDETSREDFRNGTEGAVHLTEAELTQIDELYELINPGREDNPKYSKELDEASEHLMRLYDQSTKTVSNTTYASLHDILKRVDECGYFDKALQRPDTRDDDDDDDSDMGEDELVEPVPETDSQPITSVYETYSEETAAVIAVPDGEDIDEFLHSGGPPPRLRIPSPQSPPVRQLTPVQNFVEQPPIVQDPVDSFLTKPAPPPDFAGLQAGPDFGCVDGFTFMRDSAITEVVPPEDVLVTAQPPDRYSTCVLPERPAVHRPPVAVSPVLVQPATTTTIIESIPLDEVTAVNGQTSSGPADQTYTQERQGPGGYHGKPPHRGYGGPRGGYGGQRSSGGYGNGRRNQPGGGSGGGGPRYNGPKSLPQRGGRPNYRQHNPVRSK